MNVYNRLFIGLLLYLLTHSSSLCRSTPQVESDDNDDGASIASSVSTACPRTQVHINDTVTGDEVDSVPVHEEHIIRSAMRCVFGVTPRSYQTRAIYAIAFQKRDVVVLRKTGEGKTLISLAVSLLRRGVSVFMVPLVALGVDQASKSVYTSGRIESYFLDENKGSCFFDLRRRLHLLLESTASGRCHKSVLLFATAHSLLPDSNWAPLLKELATAGLINLITMDEAHHINYNNK